MHQSARLRALLADDRPLLSVGVYDCFSAKIGEHAGFPVLSISGNALTASLLGLPDLGLITMTEVVNQARNIANSVEAPVLADGDTGYGNALNAMRAVRDFEAAGIAGLSLEDQVFPKRSSTIGKPGIIPIPEMVTKLKAACDARRSDDFVIIGRTDSRSVEGLDGAIERAVRYCDAGVDMIFINSLESAEEMRKVTRAVPKPVKINVVEGHPPSRFTSAELFGFGFKLVGYAGILQRCAGKAMLACLETFRKEDTTEGSLKAMLMTPAERYAVLGVAKYRELEAKLFGTGSKSP
ncbi:MAG TPA: oxaloacetate decarboxylase [Burkholderiales bacterium]|nr:oxaloacetate decarboxylase [Burkholderiales bacterium]